MGTRAARPLTAWTASALAAGAAVAVVAVLGKRNVATAVLVAPFALVAVIILLQHPLATLGLVVGLVIACEGPTFGLPVTPDLYNPLYKGLTALDVLVVLVLVAVLLDLMRRRQQPRLPPALVLPLVLVILAMVSGVVVGHANGVGLRDAILSMHVLTYLLVFPFVVFNLDLDERALERLLLIVLAVAMLKAVVGLVAMEAGLTTQVQSTTTATSLDLGSSTSITYYEPTANWLMMVSLAAIVAARQMRFRLPRWILLGTPLLVASLVLSYRRSFWIGSVLAILLVLLLGSTFRHRLVLVGVAVLIGASIWSVGAINFQAQTPLLQRVQSLNPSSLETNAEDRYRLDERANVIGEIKRQPITGLGMNVPWAATVAPLGIEHVDGRQYVHFALLWWWLKLGILGAAAYVSLILSAGFLAWRVWRRSRGSTERSFALASMCALVGLVVIETTASFTGVDARFSVIFGTQLGLLAVLAHRLRHAPPAPFTRGGPPRTR